MKKIEDFSTLKTALGDNVQNPDVHVDFAESHKLFLFRASFKFLESDPICRVFIVQTGTYQILVFRILRMSQVEKIR